MTPASPRNRSSASKAHMGAAAVLGDPLLRENPRLLSLVNQLANMKCLKAVNEGQIQVLRHAPPTLYIPRADIIDDPASPMIEAIFEVPGVRGDSIRVSVRGGQLVVCGHRRPTYPVASTVEQGMDGMSIDVQSRRHEPTPIVREIRYGPFQRFVKLPDGVKDSDVSARLAEGMLIVKWPRSPGLNDSDTGVKFERTSPSLGAMDLPEASEDKMAIAVQQ